MVVSFLGDRVPIVAIHSGQVLFWLGWPLYFKFAKLVGGGDSVAALEDAGVMDKIDHVSTGGGASLELLRFGSLPGLEILKS